VTFPSPAELAANGFTTASILLAGRHNIHTWWTGIAGCLLFGWVFFRTQLYADATLQLFFIATSAAGWRSWRRARQEHRPITRSDRRALLAMGAAGAATAAGYGALLHHFTDAYAPAPDSVVLAFSVLGQLLLMARRLETWWCWLLVDTIAVPLFLSRGLALTGVLYAGYWVNAVVSLRHWRRLAAAEGGGGR
jgi:nicotinamide mononucleotide transporter